jgi:fructose-bisphosphate aldolase class II
MGDYPLVLHGASSVPTDFAQEIDRYGGAMGEETAGVPEADIEIARRVGCTKVNIDTDLRLAMSGGDPARSVRQQAEANSTRASTWARPASMVKDFVRHKVQQRAVLRRPRASTKKLI